MSEEKLVFAQNYIDGKFEDGPQFLDSFNPVKYDFSYFCNGSHAISQ